MSIRIELEKLDSSNTKSEQTKKDSFKCLCNSNGGCCGSCGINCKCIKYENKK